MTIEIFFQTYNSTKTFSKIIVFRSNWSKNFNLQVKDRTHNFWITNQTPYVLSNQTTLKMIIVFLIFLPSFDLLKEIMTLESPRHLPSITEWICIIDYSTSTYSIFIIFQSQFQSSAWTLKLLSHYFFTMVVYTLVFAE